MNNNNDDNAALPLENNDKINYRLLYADRIAELEVQLTAANAEIERLSAELSPLGLPPVL